MLGFKSRHSVSLGPYLTAMDGMMLGGDGLGGDGRCSCVTLGVRGKLGVRENPSLSRKSNIILTLLGSSVALMDRLMLIFFMC